MNNKVLLAALAGGVANFLLGWLIWGILLMDLSQRMNPQVPGLDKEPFAMWAIALSCLVFALLVALIYQRWAGISTLKGGLMAGLWIGGLIGLSYDLGIFSMQNNMALSWIPIDTAANMVATGLTGAVIGWVLGR